MGIFPRLVHLIRAQINRQIDLAEAPELVLEEILREEQAQLGKVRERIRDMIALEKELEGGLSHARDLALEWDRKAEAAVAAGRDDLAREALRRKRDSAESVRLTEQDLALQRQVVARLKDQLRMLESRHQATHRRRDVLVARHRRAEAQDSVAGRLATDTAAAEMSRIERKIRRIEARADAAGELAGSSPEAQFAALSDPAIEAELRALKQRLAEPADDEDQLDALDRLDPPHPPDALKSGL